MYSKRINVAWTSKQKPKCVNAVKLLKANWPAEDISFETSIHMPGVSCQSASRSCGYLRYPELAAYHTQFMESGAFALFDYVGRPERTIAEMLLYRFLDEQVITSGLS